MQPFNFISACTILVFHCGLSAQTNYHRFIDPFVGSEGPGNVFVGPSTPFGMAKPGPDVHLRANSGYNADLNLPLLGFSQVHVSGTGGGPKYLSLIHI